MNEEKILVINNAGEDITGTIETAIPDGGRVHIKFYGHDRTYSYAKDNLDFFTDPEIIENDIAINGQVLLAENRKIKFRNYLKLFFKNSRKTELHYNDFEILSIKPSEYIKYYRAVAEQIKNLPGMDVQDRNLVTAAIDNIRIETSSPLFSYFSGNVEQPGNTPQNFIFPFQCNESQLNAVDQAFSNKLSLIQGPPGTGKTQTILNIIANALVRHMSVAVVSNNNSAIQNIIEKLAKSENLDFVTAMLGKKENKVNFLKQQPPYPEWLAETQDITKEEEQEINLLQKEIKQLFHDQNTLKIRQAELREWEIEQKKFNEHYSHVDIPADFISLSPEAILSLYSRCNYYSVKQKKLPFFLKLWYIFIQKLANLKFWNLPVETIIVMLKRLFYIRKCQILAAEISDMEQRLANADLTEMHGRLNTLSWKKLKYVLQKRFYKKATERKKFSARELGSEIFIEEYPVILSTTFMIQNSLPVHGVDLLIMDEASQVDLCTGIVSISCAKRAVIVGDTKQLPCVITSEDEEKLAWLNSTANIPSAYLYRSGQSILSSIQQALPDIPSVTLREHYRCVPFIIGFCNKRFYDNKLIIHSKPECSYPLHILFTVAGHHARGHFNFRQCEEIKKLLQDLSEKGYSPDSIGICTPYREQAEKLGASTVHKFQGREKDIIILSTVDNQITDFAADEQLLNVAVSRAKKEFFLVISSSNRKWDNCIGDLLNYIQYYDTSGDSVRYGRITSVFDLLYNEYQEYVNHTEMQKVFFDSPAEALIADLLESIFAEYDTEKRLSFKTHIPLQEIFHTTPDLTAEENIYLNHKNTHVDFLVYEKFGKMPLLGIEVDGYSFHKQGTRQAERDKLKNSIFAKNGLKLLRLSTEQSNEKERITKILFPQFFEDERETEHGQEEQ